jgi:hypothetical protein
MEPGRASREQGSSERTAQTGDPISPTPIPSEVKHVQRKREGGERMREEREEWRGETHLVEGATAARGIARGGGGSPPGKGRGVWGGEPNPRARPPGRWIDRCSRRRTGPGQALGWLAVGVELARPRVLLYRNLGWFFLPGPLWLRARAAECG